MSLTVAVVLNAVLVVGLVVLLVTVMRIPFRLDRTPAPAAAQPPDVVADERAAA